jgi:AcrR family transcriptional regulator
VTVARAHRDEDSVASSTRRYDSPIRRERAGQTRDRIIGAGAELVHGLSSWDWRKLTIRAVAERAGVHERTIYRHFATERDLREAVLQRLMEEAGVTVEGLRLEEVPGHITELFRYLASFSSSNEPPTDATLAALDQRRKDALLEAVTGAASDWSEGDLRMTAAMIDVLWGVSTYRRLVSGWGLDSAEATRGTSWLIDLITAAIRSGAPPGT